MSHTILPSPIKSTVYSLLETQDVTSFLSYILEEITKCIVIIYADHPKH